MANGKLVTEEESWMFFFAKTIFSVLQSVPFVGVPRSPAALIEARGYKPVRGGFFLERGMVGEASWHRFISTLLQRENHFFQTSYWIVGRG